jgi:hypothetical protein
MRTRFTLWAIWCCFLARAWFYCAAVPLWEGYDEFSHFALIQYVFTHHGELPLGAIPPNSSLAVAESRKLTPAAWILRDLSTGILSYEDYFDLPVAERNARRERLEHIPAEWSQQEATSREPLYEAQQAPLYYWIMAPIYGLIRGWNFPSAVLLLRLLTAAIASATIPLVFFVGRRVSCDDALALGAAVVAASFPELFILIGHVGNEGLALAAGGLFVLVSVRTLERKPSLLTGVWLGCALGAALLTKAYFLALLPLAAVVLWLAWRRNPGARAGALWQASVALCVCFAISGWWYIHNLTVTGSLTGQLEDARAMANTGVSLVGAAGRISWIRVFDFAAISYIWLGGWSFLIARSWMYRLAELLAILGFAGMCLQTVRARRGLPRPPDLWLLALPVLSMIAGLCFYAAQVFRNRGSAGTPGYYLYALIVPEAILFLTGLARLMPVRLQLLPLPVAALILLGIEQFGAWFLMFPYYAGWIRHNANGSLPAARIAHYANGGTATFFDRLCGIGPVSSPYALEAAAALYLFATAMLLWTAWRIYARNSSR